MNMFRVSDDFIEWRFSRKLYIKTKSDNVCLYWCLGNGQYN